MSSHGKGIPVIILRGPLAVTPCAGLEVSSPRAPTLGAPLGNDQNKVSYWSPKWLLCHRASSPRGPPGSSSRARPGARGGGCSARPRWARRPPLTRRCAKRPACRAPSPARPRGVEKWRLRPRPTHGPGSPALSRLWGGRSQCPGGARCSCGLGHRAGYGVPSVLGARRGGSSRQVGLEPARPGGWRRGAGAVARGAGGAAAVAPAPSRDPAGPGAGGGALRGAAPFRPRLGPAAERCGCGRSSVMRPQRGQ